MSFKATFQTEVAIGEIVPEIIRLAVLETAILIYQFGVVLLALSVIGLTDKLELLGMVGADESHIEWFA